MQSADRLEEFPMHNVTHRVESSSSQALIHAEMNADAQRGIHPGVLSLAISAFAIGVAEFLVVGVLPAIAKDLSVSLEAAGALVTCTPWRSP
jgi:hypothetical protein